MKNFDYIWKQNTLIQNISFDGISSTISNILYQRNIKNKEQASKFLSPNINNMYDSYSLHGMQDAVKRILNAIQNKEKITIYGDYDVDGMTSVSVFLLYFRHINYDVDYYIPNRLTEGYGPNEDAFRKLHKRGTNLIITVDCGISAYNEVEVANELGMDVIITDHHECPKVLPNAYAIVDPKQDNCNYPYDMLAGVGISMKIVNALMKENFYSFIPKIIDIVALGTIADVVPLLDENRIIAYCGLENMCNSENLGINDLIKISDIKGKINPAIVGFRIAPRLNAAGRLGMAELGVELLTTNSINRSEELAKKLNELNIKRQETEQSILIQAEKIIEKSNKLENDVLVIAGKNWHAGVIGIVASRISEKYYKPTVIISIQDTQAIGSARSVGKFNLHHALSSMSELFIRFGGHAQAAGLTIDIDNIDIFNKKINKYANKTITKKDKIPKLYYQQILEANNIHHDLISDLEALEPFGVANPRPKFRINNLTIDSIRTIGKDNTHLKLSLHNQSRLFDAIGFSLADKFNFLKKGDIIDIIATIEKNEFRGVETIQFKLDDIRSKTIEEQTFSSLYINYIVALTNKYVYMINNNILNKNTAYANIKVAEIWNRQKFLNEHLDYKKQIIIINNFNDFYDIWELLFDRFDGEIRLHKNIMETDLFAMKDTISQICDILICNFEINSISNKIIDYYEKIWICKNDQLDKITIPSRDDLVQVYKNLQTDVWNNKEIKIAANECLQSISTFLLSMAVLDNAKLIDYKISDNKINAKLLPKPNSKINISNNNLYKNLQKLS